MQGCPFRAAFFMPPGLSRLAACLHADLLFVGQGPAGIPLIPILIVILIVILILSLSSLLSSSAKYSHYAAEY